MWVLLDPFFFFLISFLMLHLVLRPRSQTKYELEDQIIKFFASCHFASFCHHLIPVFYIKGNACLCIFVLSVTGKCCCCSPACWDLICSKSLLSANSSNGSLFMAIPDTLTGARGIPLLAPLEETSNLDEAGV